MNAKAVLVATAATLVVLVIYMAVGALRPTVVPPEIHTAKTCILDAGRVVCWERP